MEGYPKEDGEEPPAIRPKLGPPPQESEAAKPVEKKEEQGESAKAPAPAPAPAEEVKGKKGKKGKEKKKEEGKEGTVEEVVEPAPAARSRRKVVKKYDSNGMLVGGEVAE